MEWSQKCHWQFLARILRNNIKEISQDFSSQILQARGMLSVSYSTSCKIWVGLPWKGWVPDQKIVDLHPKTEPAPIPKSLWTGWSGFSQIMCLFSSWYYSLFGFMFVGTVNVHYIAFRSTTSIQCAQECANMWRTPLILNRFRHIVHAGKPSPSYLTAKRKLESTTRKLNNQIYHWQTKVRAIKEKSMISQKLQHLDSAVNKKVLHTSPPTNTTV